MIVQSNTKIRLLYTSHYFLFQQLKFNQVKATNLFTYPKKEIRSSKLHSSYSEVTTSYPIRLNLDLKKLQISDMYKPYVSNHTLRGSRNNALNKAIQSKSIQERKY